MLQQHAQFTVRTHAQDGTVIQASPIATTGGSLETIVPVEFVLGLGNLFVLRRGGNQSVDLPCALPPAGGAQTAGSGNSQRQSASAIRRFGVSTAIPFPNRDLFSAYANCARPLRKVNVPEPWECQCGCTNVLARSSRARDNRNTRSF
jgi:hypothetical protein